MNQSNLFLRQCPQHPEKQVMFACYNKLCKLNRLVCKICFKLHSDHSDDLLEEVEIESKIKEFSTNCQLLIKQLNKQFDDLKQQFKAIIQVLESQYIQPSQTLNAIENTQLNLYLNRLIKYNDKEIELSQFVTKTLKDIQQLKDRAINNNFLPNYEVQEQKIDKMYQKKIDDVKDNINDKQVIYQDQNHLQSLSSKGDTLRWMNQYKESIEWYDKALAIDSKYTLALCGKGHALIHFNMIRMMDQYQESIEWYDKTLAIDSKYTDALCSKGEALRMMDQYNEALRYLNFALQIESNHEQSLGSKGACLVQLGKIDEAEKCLNQAIKLNPYNQFSKNQLQKLQEMKKY